VSVIDAPGEAGAASVEAEAGLYPPPLLAWVTVAVLFVAYIFSFIDRMIIGLLVEPMKADLNLSDTQISLLQGLAFAIFYTLVGLPLGRLIDRAARLRVAAVGVALWSIMTMACGLAGQYWQLFVARMGVGVGEATLSPAAYSIISDSFPQRRMGLAMGVYGLGSAVGAGLAFIIGAAVIQLVTSAGTLTLPLIGEVRAWQATFMIVGLPGLVIAAVLAMMPEPARLAVSEPARRDPGPGQRGHCLCPPPFRRGAGSVFRGRHGEFRRLRRSVLVSGVSHPCPRHGTGRCRTFGGGLPDSGRADWSGRGRLDYRPDGRQVQ
jgi:MFS family permease